MRYDLLLCGVGGQGIITLSEIVATAAVSNGHKTIVTQSRGLAQRGGAVRAHIRIGDVYAPLMPKKAAHCMISLELSESLRYVEYLNPDTIKAVSTTVVPTGGEKKKKKGPSAGELRIILEEKVTTYLGGQLLIVEAERAARDAGVPRGANIFMIGILCGMDPRIESFISRDDMARAVETVVRHDRKGNLLMFEKGTAYGESKKQK